MENFGERLKSLRTERELSQRMLAKELKIGNSIISAWEKNLKEPTLSNIKKIAIYFKVSADYLIGLED